VVRYAFIVSDFHRLLLAGLPAHFESDHPSHGVGLREAFFGCVRTAELHRNCCCEGKAA
jgi:hypothetical protein